MPQIKQLALLVLLAGFLTACNEKKDYDFLMTHPDALQKAVRQCQASNVRTPECESAMQAANDFMGVLQQQQLDPEAFGQKVLATQYALAVAREKLAEAKTEGFPSEKLADLKTEFKQKCQETKIYLAVISLTSPE